MKSFKWLVHLMRPYWRRIFLALILSALTTSSYIGLMAASAYLLARAALHPPILDLMVTIVGVRFFGLSRAVLRYLERYVSHDVTFRVLSQIRLKFYQSLEPLAPARLADFHSGDLLDRIVADVETQQNFYLRVFAPPFSAVLVLLGYGFFLARFDERLSILLAVGFLSGGFVIPWGVKFISRGIAEQLVGLKAKLTEQVADSLQGMSELAAFGQTQTYLDEIEQTDKFLQKKQGQMACFSALSSALIGMTANLGLWFTLVLGILLVEKKLINGVNLSMLALGTFSSFEALFPLALVPQHSEQSRAAADRLLELIEAEPAVTDKNREAVSPLPEKLDIVFRNISFKYTPDEPWALEHLSFRISQQEKVAIVGPSGAGKTSVVNLLMRFWEWNQGQIELGGYSLRSYSQEDFRKYIGVVTQRTHLFNATIRENLLMAKPDAADWELIQAAQKAKLHDFILSLPRGYDSYVGEGGFSLSGGQRQRLAIARVLLKNAPILVLDEAMAGLDPVTEGEVMAEIQQLMQQRTTLVITHRLNGLAKMDKILVMDRGQIVQRGKHSELILQAGLYRSLWENSLGSYSSLSIL